MPDHDGAKDGVKGASEYTTSVASTIVLACGWRVHSLGGEGLGERVGDI